MKLDIVKTIIAIMLGGIIAYSLSLCKGFEGNILYPTTCFIEFAIVLSLAMGLNLKWMRTMANIKITSWLFFIAMLILNIIFAFVGISTQAFLISNLVLILICILSIYSLAKATKE